MRRKGDEMGRFSVEVEFVNNEDLIEAKLGHLAPEKVRRTKVQGVVDSGAAYLVVPRSIVEKIGLPVREKKIKVKYADGRRATRSEADQIRLHLQGRDGLFKAIIEPKRETALIGALVLEDMDFLIDSKRQRLVPRDPDFVLSEIE